MAEFLSRIEAQLIEGSEYNGPYLSRIELILKDILAKAGKIGFRGPYDSVEDLPDPGEEGYIYLVETSNPEDNYFDEYYYNVTLGAYVSMGTSELELSNYFTKQEVTDLLAAKQSKTLTTAVTIQGVVYTTVEGALVALSDMSGAEFVSVLPQASADTLDKLYVLEVTGEDPALYVTKNSSGTYSWFKLSGSDVEVVTSADVQADYDAIFGDDIPSNPNLINLSTSVINTSDVTIVDP